MLTHRHAVLAHRGGDDPLERLCEQGVGYVGFALTWPGRFALMFRADLFTKDEALVASADAAYQVLEDGIRGLYALAPGTPLAPWRTSSGMSLL